MIWEKTSCINGCMVIISNLVISLVPYTYRSVSSPSRSLREAWSISLTFWRPFKVSSRVAVAASCDWLLLLLLLIGSDNFRLCNLEMGEGDPLDAAAPVNTIQVWIIMKPIFTIQNFGIIRSLSSKCTWTLHFYCKITLNLGMLT